MSFWDFDDEAEFTLGVEFHCEGHREEPRLHGHPDARHDGGGENEVRVKAIYLDGEEVTGPMFDVLVDYLFPQIEKLAESRIGQHEVDVDGDQFECQADW